MKRYGKNASADEQIQTTPQPTAADYDAIDKELNPVPTPPQDAKTFNLRDAITSSGLVGPAATLPACSQPSEETAPPSPTPVTEVSPYIKNPDIKLATDINPNVQPQQNPYMQMMQNQTAHFNMQEQAIAAAANIGVAKGAEEAAQINKNISDQNARIKADQEAWQDQQNKLAEQHDKLQAKIDQTSSLSIDPNRFWASKGTGDKVIAGIALALGALSTNGNQAVPVIQSAINRDIDAQKANIGIKEKGVENQKGFYADMLNTFRDDRLARAATTAAYYQNAGNQIQAIAAKYSSPEAQANAMNLLAQVEQKKQEATNAFMMQYQSMMPLSPNTNPEMLPPEKRERMVPGYSNFALDKPNADDMKTTIGKVETAKDYITQLQNLASQPGAATIPAKREEVKRLVNLTIGAIKDPVLGTSKLSENSEDFFKEMVADPSKLFSLGETNKKELGALKDNLDTIVSSRAKAYGLKSFDDQLGLKKKSGQ